MYGMYMNGESIYREIITNLNTSGLRQAPTAASDWLINDYIKHLVGCFIRSRTHHVNLAGLSSQQRMIGLWDTVRLSSLTACD
ncbi:Hypothetical predicted protein [Cloeon dipterum]|uniref:Uncharacterized protein n=1 Tax=Cloeon dipterum TaxID=197152 RepID=A0A8S1DA78_9INSE|nr:Hypothetical predicted protein [Cloeon dipterum]